ncbi:MAG: hypothetical protein H6833_07430 [Planctomycetes bacterium]|nr:hypothetical protein [Planctomycetota bacterium]
MSIRTWIASCALLAPVAAGHSALRSVCQDDERQTGSAQAVTSEPERLVRLATIATELQDPASDAPSLTTEAARLCGFAIWNEDREVIAEPLGSPRLGLALTDVEIRAYARLFREGDSVALDDFVAALDILAKDLVETSIRTHVDRLLRDGWNTSHASVRALASFLEALSNQRVETNARLDATQGVRLDPIQVLFLLRIVTEDLGVPLRRAIANTSKAPPAGPGKHDEEFEYALLPNAAPSSGATPREDPAPGWAEDAYVGGITGIFGEVANRLGQTGQNVSSWIGKANALASIAKFLSTYTFLTCELGVDAPGQPLVRTKTTDAGEPRTIFARFVIDGTRVTDWMKENRKLVALAGLDLDMAKTGALSGVETHWQIEQDKRSARKHLVQTQRGKSNLTRVKTDSNGEARIYLEGTPQPRNLDPLNVLPVMKAVRIWVTPQAKSVEMQQDVLDAVTGAIGIHGGGVGFLTPVIETLYRMKWTGTRGFDLHVRDWVDSETIGQGEIIVRASGNHFERNTAHRMQLDRTLRFTDVSLQSIGVEPPEAPDPELLKRVSKQVRQQIEQGYQMQLELSKRRTFLGMSAKGVSVHVHDAEMTFGPEAGCSQELFTTTRTWNGDRESEWTLENAAEHRAQFLVDVNFETKTAIVNLDARVLATMVTTSTKTGARTETGEADISMLSGLTLLAPHEEHIVLPLEETRREDLGTIDYRGTGRVPFRFGGDRFRGTAIVSFSATRKIPPKEDR